MLVDLDAPELGLLVRVVSLARHAEVVLRDCTEDEQQRLKVLASKLEAVRIKENEGGNGSAGAAENRG